MPVTFKTKMGLAEADAIASRLQLALLQVGFTQVTICGSIRRRAPEVGDIDVVVEGDIGMLHSIPAVSWREGGEFKATVEYEGLQVNVLRSDAESWGAAIMYFTGPGFYNIGYRVRAKKMGLLLNEYGLYREGERIAGRTEEEIYTVLKKPYKPPEKRGE